VNKSLAKKPKPAKAKLVKTTLLSTARSDSLDFR
jgi:hypothetical protein